VTEFHRIGILGPGLLGGSLALALAKRHPRAAVKLWGRSAERVAEVRQGGFEHVTVDFDLAVRDTELIVLAVPVGVMEGLARRLLEAGVGAGQFVTDVGSVKCLPHQKVGALLKSGGVKFAGSHPMAGSDLTGFDAADADLFDGAPCILTNDEGLEDDDINRLVGFWAGLGARAAIMSAEEHDRLVARISHAPHVMAVVCALVALSKEEDGHFSGGGLRDTSRVAAGDPQMWAEILLENRESVVAPIRECVSALTHLSELIEEGNEGALVTVLEEAQHRRKLLS
jgi:prephenate dehydrogenase